MLKRLATETGMRDIAVFRDNDRWLNIHARLEDEPVYVKCAKEPSSDERKMRIAREVWAHHELNQGDMRLPSGYKIVAPKVKKQGGYWYAAEWVEASPPMERVMHNFGGREAFAACVPWLAEMSMVIDAFQPATAAEGDGAQLRGENARKHYKKWVDDTIESEMPMASVEQALKVVEASINDMGLQFQLGDFAPWQFLMTNDTLYVCDAEHASCYLPRFYDVATLSARVWQECGAGKEAREFMGRVQQLAGLETEEFWRAIKPSLIWRAVGVYTDAVKIWQQQGIDTRPAAHDLLESCLNNAVIDW